jgi:hypothetical protein
MFFVVIPNSAVMRIIVLLLMIIPFAINAQTYSNLGFTDEVSFIENQGQFNDRNWKKNSEIEYAIDKGAMQIFFSKQGLTYRFDKIIRNEARKTDPKLPKRINISELIHVSWVDANEDVQIIVEEPRQEYFSYAVKNLDTREVVNKNNVPGYRKLTYKNLYDNIDVVYELYQGNQLKYSVILHPGADPSQVKMKYISDHTNTKDENIKIYQTNEGEIKIETSLGEIKETNPETFYQDDNEIIISSFVFENNILSFNLESYDNTKTVVIDPWIESPTLNTSTAVWEVECDGSGNVYIIGGETPMVLKKYDASGAIQWTYTTPWDTASVWLGTLATDENGNSYITSGTSPEIEKVNNGGSMEWHQDGGAFSSDEYWSITFNCDNKKLLVGGTRVPNPLGFDYYAAIFDMDITNGEVQGYVTFEQTNIGGFGVMPKEVRSISSSANAKYIYLTHDNVGAINQNIGACPTDEPVYHVDNGHHLAYKCENYLPATQNGGGLKAIVANDQFFYTHSGDKIYKRDLDDGSLITSVNLPGGSNETDFLTSSIIMHCSGLDVDDCGNVYAGSVNQLVKFDADLNVLAQETLDFTVYDVSVNSNGEVLAVGAQQDNESTNRNGRIQSVAQSACAQFELVCCDANICPVDPLCSTDAPITLTPSTPGGTWSGTGVNPTTGVFDPAAAGSGVFTITYTLPCGFDVVDIVVNPCLPASVCYDGTNLIASGGTGTLVWEDYETISTPIDDEQDCIDCPFADPIYMMGFYVDCDASTCDGTGWVEFGTGYTVAPPSSWPMQISDDNGVLLTYNSLDEIPPCSGCTPPTLSYSVTDVTCSGDSDGAIDLTISGTSTYTIFWSNSQSSEDLSGLSAGNYSVTVTDDADPSCTSTATITVGAGNTVNTPSFTGQTALCDGESTTIGLSESYSGYSWSTGATSSTINVTTAGNYAVTVSDAAGCTSENNIDINVSSVPTANAGSDEDICNGGSVTLTASGGSTYNWNTGASTASTTVNPATTTIYTVTVTVNGCSSTDNVTVTVNALPNANAGADQTICSGGSTVLTATGGGTYLWSTGETTSSITVGPLSNQTYSVTVTSTEGCIATDDVSVDVGADLVATIDASANPICIGQTTQLSAGGGTTFLWSTGETTATINVSPVVATTYDVTVSDATGCSGTAQVTITINAGPEPELGNGFGICDGESASLSTSLAYASYSWSTGETTQSITISSTGVYTITVTDANGCTGTDDINIYQNSAPPANAGTDQTICDGGVTTLTATGGVSYLWDSGATNQTISVAPVATTTYSVTVTDANGCTAADDVTVTVGSELIPTIDASSNPLCYGETAQLSAGGGTIYNWSTGDVLPSIYVSPITTTTYTVTVSDGAGCSGEADITITINPAPTPDLGADISLCQGESATLQTTETYQGYLWSNGNTNSSLNVSTAGSYSVTITDANGCTGSDIVEIAVNSLPDANAGMDQTICIGSSVTLSASGGDSYQWNTGENQQSIIVFPTTTTSYTVTVTENGCSSTDNVVITVNDGLDANITTAMPDICIGDSTVLIANGGTSFLWSTGETTQTITVAPSGTVVYSVTVSDDVCEGEADIQVTVADSISIAISPATICEGETATIYVSNGGTYEWSTGETTQSIDVTPSSTTTYYVTVTEDNCSNSTSATVTVNSLPTADAGEDQAICEGESADLFAVGGSIYEWSTGAMTSDITVTPSSSLVYSVTITENGCSAVDDVMVTVNPAPDAEAGDDVVICQGDSTVLQASGGSDYEWSTGDNVSAVYVSPSNDMYYYVTVSQNGCSASDSIYVSIDLPPVISTSPDATICAGNTAVLSVYGAESYLWSTGQTDSVINVSPNVSMDFIVEGSSGECSAIDTIHVEVDGGITPVVTASLAEICTSQSTLLTASGGDTYLWNTGATTDTISVSPNVTTTYSVTVSDDFCSGSTDIQISVLPDVVATSSPSVICNGESTVLTVSAGTSYIWSTGQTTQSITVSPTTTTSYYVTVTGDLCSDSTEVVVFVEDAPDADAGMDQTICWGESASLLASGGVNYYWSNYASDPGITVTPGQTTMYSVTVANAMGCEAVDFVTVNVNPLPNAYAGPDQWLCEGGSTKLVSAGGELYSWTPGTSLSSSTDQYPTAFPDSTTVYTVVVTDINGCTDSDQTLVTVYPNVNADITIHAAPDLSICKGDVINFSADVVNEGDEPQYNWVVDNVYVGTNYPYFSTSDLNDGSQIMCYLTSSEHCVIDNPVSDAVSVSVEDKPIVNFSYNLSRSCAPLHLYLNELCPDDNAFIEWTIEDGSNVYTSTENNPDFVLEAGQYDLTMNVTSVNGCTNSLTIDNGVVVYPNPEANISAQPPSASLMDPVVTFLDLRDEVYMNFWDLGDGYQTITHNSFFEHTYTNTGTFDVLHVAYNQYNCTDTAHLEIEVTDFVTLYVPTAFTPETYLLENGHFQVYANGIEEEFFELMVYNRW